MRKVLFILSELADGDVDWMIGAGSKTAAPAGTVLIEEGKPIEVLYVVLEGQLAVTLDALDGKEIARLQSGEILGELSFLDSRPPTATVTAVEPSMLLSIPRALLTAKLEQDSAFAARFYRALGVFLASRLRKSLKRLGYDSNRILDEETEHEDELDPDVLEHVALAGARFDWMLKRLREASPNEPSREG
jgi:bacteriocin-type transport-associated protein